MIFFSVITSGLAACSSALGAFDFIHLKMVGVSAIEPDKGRVFNSNDSAWLARSVIAVEIDAGMDLEKYARQYEYNLISEVSYCGDGSYDQSRPLQNDPYLHRVPRRAENSSHAVSGDGNSYESGKAPDYKIYIWISSIPLAGKEVFKYDMRLHSEDVCIKLAGGNMLGTSIVSNTLVVPRALVDRALGASQSR